MRVAYGEVLMLRMQGEMSGLIAALGKRQADLRCVICLFRDTVSVD